jgi:phage terminase large subunit-like protein
MVALAELCGPSRFSCWSDDGEPVAMMPAGPLVQVVACSEDQASNTYDAVYQMSKESDLNGSLIDVGRMKMLVNGPGTLEPVTSAAGTRLGQRVTFAVMDETHLWLKQNGGHRLAATIRRNAGKMNGRTFESTNAHLPGEDSVAERTFKAHLDGAAGLLYDSVEAPDIADLTDRGEVTKALEVAYGDARWVDLHRLADEIADPSTDPQDARRFYFNQLVAGADQFLDVQAWERLASERIVEPGEPIGLGFDGSISDDRTCLYGCTRDGFVFELGVWETRQGETMIRRSEVHDAVREAFATYDVGLMLCDPPKWWSEIEQWAKEHGDERVVALDTNQARRFAPLCDRFATEVRQASISHDGKPTLTHHLAACARKNVRLADDSSDGRSRFVIVKADTRKIDAAVAAVLAREAAATMPEKSDDVEPWVSFG